MVVCAGCFRKKPGARTITKEMEEFIQERVYSEFSMQNEAFPKVICPTCRHTFLDVKKNGENSHRKLPPKPDYENFKFPAAMTRQSAADKCSCTTCLIGREKGNGKVYTYEGNPLGRPRTIPKSPAGQTIPVCSKCLTIKKKGAPHVCRKTTMEENIPLLIKNRSAKGQAKIAGKLIVSHAQKEGVSTRGGIVELPTGGKPIQIQVGKPQHIAKPTRFTMTDLKRLQRKFKFSGNAIKGRPITIKGCSSIT